MSVLFWIIMALDLAWYFVFPILKKFADLDFLGEEVWEWLPWYAFIGACLAVIANVVNVLVKVWG